MCLDKLKSYNLFSVGHVLHTSVKRNGLDQILINIYKKDNRLEILELSIITVEGKSYLLTAVLHVDWFGNQME